MFENIIVMNLQHMNQHLKCIKSLLSLLDTFWFCPIWLFRCL